jgi:hypothetical protein
MTTSFAHFVRGQFLRSAQANPAGLWLAVCCAVQIPWSFKIAITGRYRSLYSVSEILVWVLLSLTLVASIHWGIRLLF